MAFFMDIIRDSRRRVAGRNDAGIAQWPGAPDGDVLPGQEAAPPLPDAEPKPKKSGVRLPRRQPPLSTEGEDRPEGVEKPTPAISVENPGSEAGRLGPEAATPPTGPSEVEAAPPVSVTHRIAPGQEPPAVQQKASSSRPPAPPFQSPVTGRSGIGLSPVEVDSDRPPGSPGLEPATVPAREGTRLSGSPSQSEPSGPPDIAAGRSGVRIGGRERSTEPATLPGRIPMRDAPPGERVSIPEGAVDAPSAVAAPARPEAAAGVQGHREPRSGSGPPVVRIGRVNVIVESAREIQKPRVSTTPGEDLASRTFLRSL